MAVLPILHWPDARLCTPCAAVGPVADLAVLAANMLDTMYAARGRGLAAPQVGVLLRMFVMDVTWKEGAASPLVCLNPLIVAMSAQRITGPEGCLSIPGITTLVDRATEITMGWTGLDGAQHQKVLTGFSAICAQHEIDHLDGLVTFDRLPPAARAAALAEYVA